MTHAIDIDLYPGAVDTVEQVGYTIDEQLCFALHSASRAMTARYRHGLEAIGLTYTQYVVMLVLWEHGAVTMSYLCERVQSDSGTLSPLLKRLERQGTITRRRRAEDERTLEIAITPAGEELRSRAMAVRSDVERATGLDHDTLARLRDDLQRLSGHLRDDLLAVDEGPDGAAQAACSGATTFER